MSVTAQAAGLNDWRLGLLSTIAKCPPDVAAVRLPEDSLPDGVAHESQTEA